jgi:phage terminase large subunit-like protein
MRKRNIFLPIVELTHNQTQKETRIRGLLPRYSSGSIFHIEGESKELEHELLTFPKSINDDTMDATAYQLQIAEQHAVAFSKTMQYNQSVYDDNPYL